MSQQTIVRHYRAATRGEAEQAYRADALKAARAGFVAVQHMWTEDDQGVLLAATFSGPDVDEQEAPEPTPQPSAIAVAEPETERAPQPSAVAEPQAEAEPEPAVAEVPVEPQPAPPAYQPVQRIVPVQRVEPVAEPEPEPEPVAQVEPEPEAEPVAQVEPEPEAEPVAQVEPEPEAEPVAQAEPEPPVVAAAANEPSIVAAEPQPVTIADLNGSIAAPVHAADEFAPTEPSSGPATFEPAPDALADMSWTPTPEPTEPTAEVERYTPPAEMYEAPADLYVPVEVEQAEAVEPEPSGESEPGPEAEPAPATVDEEPTPVPEALGRSNRLTVQVMDLHTAGEPLRLIRSGFPDVPSMPVLERRQWVKDNADHVRRALMFEPRGHKDMYGAILLPPYNDYADMTVLFMHNEGYSTMCGHGVIAITTGLIEEGLYPASEPVTTIRYEVPAGIVAANAATVRLPDGTWAVRGVRFTNVPSYLASQSLSVRPDGVELHGIAAQYGALGVDLAFGGAYYGIVNAAEVGLRVVPEQADELRRVGAAITDVLRRDHTPAHPSDPDLSFVYGTIIVDLDPRTSPDGKARDAHIRNATIFAEAELDRSPCGSGTSAILAQLYARGRIKVGQEIINAGITGEHFLGRVEAETALGPYAAVSTSIAGTAYVTGYSTFVVDARDPLGDGFLLG